jgi:deoxycytidylate deaminase
MINMNDNHMFAAAREVSFTSDFEGGNRVRIGTVVAYKGSILAKASNTSKTHPRQKQLNVYRFHEADVKNGKCLAHPLHSELKALQKVRWLDIDFSKVHIYVYRELLNGKLGMSRPCAACMAAIRNMGIKHIHYTTYDGYCHEVLK